ncbi:MAG TPA: hypothetical protein VNQ76_14575 [Planctomicrobium sp.]|nr:hypothetical protein [Planctomicrobium sp.]
MPRTVLDSLDDHMNHAVLLLQLFAVDLNEARTAALRSWSQMF